MPSAWRNAQLGSASAGVKDSTREDRELRVQEAFGRDERRGGMKNAAGEEPRNLAKSEAKSCKHQIWVASPL